MPVSQEIIARANRGASILYPTRPVVEDLVIEEPAPAETPTEPTIHFPTPIPPKPDLRIRPNESPAAAQQRVHREVAARRKAHPESSRPTKTAPSLPTPTQEDEAMKQAFSVSNVLRRPLSQRTSGETRPASSQADITTEPTEPEQPRPFDYWSEDSLRTSRERLASFGTHDTAVALAFSSSFNAAGFLISSPEQARSQLLEELLRVDPTAQETLDFVAQRGNPKSVVDPKSIDVEMHAADILYEIDDSTQNEILEELKQTNPDAFKRIERCMFSFKDIKDFTPGSIGTLLKEAKKQGLSNTDIGRALRTTTPMVLNAVLRAMPEKDQKEVIRMLEDMGPQRLDNIATAQKKIERIARNLKQDGTLKLQSETEKQETAQVSKPFDFLKDHDPSGVARVIEKEGPQTLAAILANASPNIAANVLSQLSEKTRIEVTARMKQTQAIAPDVLGTLTALVREKTKVVAPVAQTSPGDHAQPTIPQQSSQTRQQPNRRGWWSRFIPSRRHIPPSPEVPSEPKNLPPAPQAQKPPPPVPTEPQILVPEAPWPPQGSPGIPPPRPAQVEEVSTPKVAVTETPVSREPSIPAGEETLEQILSTLRTSWVKQGVLDPPYEIIVSDAIFMRATEIKTYNPTLTYDEAREKALQELEELTNREQP